VCVCVFVCLLVTFVSSAKTAEPIEMPFRGWLLWVEGNMYSMASRLGELIRSLDGWQFDDVAVCQNLLTTSYLLSTLQILFSLLITGPPTHSVGGRLLTVADVCRHLSGSVTLHGGPAGGFTRAGQAIASWRFQSNYSSTVTLHGGPIVLRAVRATPCFLVFLLFWSAVIVTVNTIIFLKHWTR